MGKICKLCGEKIQGVRQKAHNLKYCVECRKEVHRRDSRTAYAIKTGKIFKKENKPKRFFIWNEKKAKTTCDFDACPFKSGNKPCLFYFEYKDGSSSCPGKRFMKGSDRSGLEKGSD